MNNRALFCALLGLLLLIALLAFTPPVTVSSPTELASFNPNQRVRVQGTVIADRLFEDERRLTLDNRLTLHCSSCPAPQSMNKRIRATATVQRFHNRTWLEVYSFSFVP